MPKRTPARKAAAVAEDVLGPEEETLLDVLDHLLNKGVMLNGDITLGVAGIDPSTCACRRCCAPPIACCRTWPNGRSVPGIGRRSALGPFVTRKRGGVAAPRRKRSAGRRRNAGERANTTNPRPSPPRNCETSARAPAPDVAALESGPDDVQRSVAQLVLTIVEFLRRLMERQAIRRMEQRTLTPKEVEAVGLALMQLEKTVRDIGKRFGLRRKISISISDRSEADVAEGPTGDRRCTSGRRTRRGAADRSRAR